MKYLILGLLLVLGGGLPTELRAKTWHVGPGQAYLRLKPVLAQVQDGDTVKVHGGFYREGNLRINRRICLWGLHRPVLDGDRKYEVLSIHADGVTVRGFKVQHSSYATLDDPGGIKVYESRGVQIIDNILYDNFFGIYLQYSRQCRVENNRIVALAQAEQEIGNGIHCWKSDSLQIIGNDISGNRDGIYFEFVTHSVIWRNRSYHNIRYGLHFMFSDHDAYFTNEFRNNGAGVAVMYTKHVVMMNNFFSENWGDAAYGILLKEISDCTLSGNHFTENTTAVFMDGVNRLQIDRNQIQGNGWGLKIQANCMDNVVEKNNFMGNTFDVSTNGTLTLNNFNQNYWDKYEGYDLDRDQIGDVPYHPLSLYAVIVAYNPPAMLLFRSFMVSLLDRTEKILPSITPDGFVDAQPLTRALPL